MKKSNLFLFGNILINVGLFIALGIYIKVYSNINLNLLEKQITATMVSTKIPGPEWRVATGNSTIKVFPNKLDNTGPCILQCADTFRIWGKNIISKGYVETSVWLTDLDCSGEKTIAFKFKIPMNSENSEVFMRFHWGSVYFSLNLGKHLGLLKGIYAIGSNSIHSYIVNDNATDSRVKLLKGATRRASLGNEKTEYTEMRITISSDRRIASYYINSEFIGSLLFEDPLEPVSGSYIGLMTTMGKGYNDIYLTDLKVTCN